MENLSNYKKIRILLLVLVLIAAMFLVISVVKRKNEKIKPNVLETVSAVDEQKNEEPEIKEKPKEEEPEVVENPEDTSWDEEDAKDTKVEDPKKEEKESKETYFLKVNYTANVVTAYKKDNSGKYTVPVKAMVCSTGTATPTSGTYKMSNKYRWHQLNGGVYGQYCSRITGHILFHSVPYKTNSPDTLKYAAYDKLGTKASAGCIRLTVADAYWIYSNCASGTYVEFYSSKDPGPLGKPTAQKISSNETCRNWDPTDPLPENPWKGYVAPASSLPEEASGNTKKDENSSSNMENQEQKPENSNTENSSKNNNIEPKPEENTGENTNSIPDKKPEPTPEPEPKPDNTANNTGNNNTENNTENNTGNNTENNTGNNTKNNTNTNTNTSTNTKEKINI